MNTRLQDIIARKNTLHSMMVGLLLWLIFSANAASALDPGARFQDYVLDNWNIESGLPQTAVISITQDGAGYLWLGTQNGIARFDGVRFTSFTREDSGVDTSMATVAYTDRNGDPWFGTPNGALHYTNGKFNMLRAGQTNAAVQGIGEDSDGSLLFATSLGIMRYSDGQLKPKALDGQPCYSLLRQGDALWVGGVGELIRVGANDTKRYWLPGAAATARIGHLLATPNGLLLGTSAGLYRFHDGVIDHAGLDPDLDRLSIESLFQDSGANLWIGTAPTLFRIQPGRVIERIANEDFVRDSWVLSIYEDREHNLWLGSQTESLFRLWNGWARRISQHDGLTDPFVWSVVRDPHGNMVLGTNSNVVVLGADGPRELVSGKALPNPSAYDLFYDSHGRLWIGTRGGVAIYANGKVEQPPALAALDSYQINAIAEIGDDFWIGTMGGLYKYHNEKLERVGPPPGGSEARVRSIHTIDDGDILIGTEAGVRVLHSEILQTPAWAKKLADVFITSIGEIRQGLIAITTLDSGIALVSGDHLIMLTSAQGLPTNNSWTSRVINGYLYVAGNDGAWRLPLDALPDPVRATDVMVNPETVLGASGRERGSQRIRCCNGGAMARSAVDGDNFWLPTISGALRLDTRAIVTLQQAPRVVIERLRYGKQWYGTNEVPSLSGHGRDVEIEFTGLSFRNSQSLHFRYQLEGYDDNWIDSGTRRAAFYTNLPPGDYRFHVQAVLPDGVANGNDVTLNFSLPPRWFERTWVRLGLILGGVGLAVLLVTWRLQWYRTNKERLERLVNERTQALRRANERLHEANLTLAQESRTDPLTGLSNRRYLQEHIRQILDDGVNDETSLAFLLLDLDKFKRVNDDFGHAAGDSVLVQLAQLLRNMARTGDELLRWGGEEFLIVLKRVRPEQVLETAERIRTKFAAHTFQLADGRTLNLTISIGFAMHPLSPKLQTSADWTLALEFADAALYRVKQWWGRNGCAGLIAGPALTTVNVSETSALHVDALVEVGALRWLRPVGAPVLRLVRNTNN